MWLVYIELVACVLMEVLCIPLHRDRYFIACIQLCKTAHRSEHNFSLISYVSEISYELCGKGFIPEALDTDSKLKKRSGLTKPQNWKSLVTNLKQFSLVHILPA
jgi:hypothetical protein